MRYVALSDLEAALCDQARGVRLGEYLIQQGQVERADLYEALSLQQNVPLGKPGRAVVSRAVTRSFPAEMVRRWHSLPFQIAAGLLWVASPELPSDQMQDELHQFSSLEIQLQLVTPTEFQELAREYLPEE